MNKEEAELLEGIFKRAEEKEKILCAAERLLSETSEPDFAGFIKSVFAGIGLKQMYVGMAGIIGVSFAAAVLLAYLVLQVMLQLGEGVYAAAFFSAPLLYASIFLLSWLKERESGSFELLMSCKYTFFHVLAARMLGECLMGFVFNGVYVFALAVRFRADGIRLFAVSFSSLMVFSLLFAGGLLLGRGIRGAAAGCALWFLANLVVLFALPSVYGRLLRGLPVLLFIAVGICGVCVHVRQLMSLTAPTFRKEYANAANTRRY